jgi:hypothetical protein
VLGAESLGRLLGAFRRRGRDTDEAAARETGRTGVDSADEPCSGDGGTNLRRHAAGP